MRISAANSGPKRFHHYRTVSRGRYDASRWLQVLTAIADPQQPVALICYSGKRSRKVARMLDEQFGYRHVYNVRHGISGWIAEDRLAVDHR